MSDIKLTLTAQWNRSLSEHTSGYLRVYVGFFLFLDEWRSCCFDYVCDPRASFRARPFPLAIYIFLRT